MTPGTSCGEREPRNIIPVAVYYLSQADIARELEISSEAVRLLRMRYPSDSAHPFPEPDAWIGVDDRSKTAVRPADARVNPRENSRGVPGWLPSRADEIREWRAGLPGSGAGGGRPRRVTPS